jgi:hypothetical protein
VTDLNLYQDLVDYQAKDPQQALDAALAAVRSYCGWHIAPSVTATADVWSHDCRSVFVETLNLTAVTTVTQDAVVVDPTTYTFESYGLIRRSACHWFSGRTRVTVAFTHGYAELPDDVKGVVLSLAQRSLTDTRGLVVRPGSMSATGGTFVETYGPQFSEADKAKLAHYAIAGGFA